MFEGQIERQVNGLLEPYVERIAQLEKHVASLRTRVGELEEALRDMRDAQSAMASDAPADGASPSDAHARLSATAPQSAPASATRQVCFLPAPGADGCFAGASTTEQVGKSIYQLSTTDGVHGTFIMMDSPDAIATAMISVSQFVKPVCKVIGNTSAYPRAIDTIEEGTAVLEHGIWRVLSKAVVRFD